MFKSYPSLEIHDSSAICCHDNLHDLLEVPAEERNSEWVRAVERETVHLSVAVWGNRPDVEYVDGVVTMFKKTHTAIEELELANKDKYTDQILNILLRINDLKSYMVGGEPMEPALALKIAGSEKKEDLLRLYR